MTAAFLRTLVLYFTLVVMMRVMGKRQIGEMEPTELAVTILLSELAALPMNDPGKPLLAGLIPMCALLGVELVLSWLFLKSKKLWRLFEGKPAVLVKNGAIQTEILKKNAITQPELIENLRGEGVAKLDDVAVAVLETGGKLSVLLNEDKQDQDAVWQVEEE